MKKIMLLLMMVFSAISLNGQNEPNGANRTELNSSSQKVNYGVNDEAGRYVKTEDANIYYEVYSEGRPVVLLHGGYAYIDQFKGYIPILSKKYKVIAVAHRGYGKSEIGTKEFSYRLLAKDLKAILYNFVSFGCISLEYGYPQAIYKFPISHPCRWKSNFLSVYLEIVLC